MKYLLLLLCILLSYSFKMLSDPLVTIHFLNTGSSDGILIESEGRFGLIDSGDPYKYSEHEVVKVEIDPSKNETHQWKENPDRSVQVIVNYLKLLGVKHLDFMIGTHAHSDHIGGIPALAYYFVDEETTYYYREYLGSIEDKTLPQWANRPYFIAAKKSMETKKAKMVEVTNKQIEFQFGKAKISILNTAQDPEILQKRENKDSITQLLQVGDFKIFLAADMIVEDSLKLKDQLGKIDVLKLAHHGYSESTYEFLSKVKPYHVVVTNSNIGNNAKAAIPYLQQILQSKVYYTGTAPLSSHDPSNAAVKLMIYDHYYKFENNKDIELKTDGWTSWYDHWIFLKNGLLSFSWQQLKWKGGLDWFYFNIDGLMVVGWQHLKWSKGEDWFYFDDKNGFMLTKWQFLKYSKGTGHFYFDDKNGFMYTGWHDLDWTGGHDTFYFDPEDGHNLRNCCRVIDGKECCFDENGVYIR